MVASNCNAIKFGTPGQGGFRNIAISNCVIKTPSENDLFGYGAYMIPGVTARRVKDMSLSNIRFNVRFADHRPAVWIEDGQQVRIDKVTSDKHNTQQPYILCRNVRGCYSGIDPSGDWQRAMTNCVVGLTPVVEMAAKYGVTIVMELFSSNRSKELWWQHTFPYYACNSAKKGAELAIKLNMANFKLLYDVWQMNDMGAKVESDISKYGEYIGHYHISGAGRKLWRGDDAMRQADIVQTIVKSGYKGYIGIELLIERDIPLAVRTAAEMINN